MKRAVVCGAGGFIASHLVKRLKQEGYWVRAVDVKLPEEGAAEAVSRLSALQRDYKILDRDLLAIDLRQADRVVMRLGEVAATARAEMLKARPKQAKGNPT